jgi:hypothetical protein
MTSKWGELVNESKERDSSVVVDILDWTFKAALDVVGLGSFQVSGIFWSSLDELPTQRLSVKKFDLLTG